MCYAAAAVPRSGAVAMAPGVSGRPRAAGTCCGPWFHPPAACYAAAAVGSGAVAVAPGKPQSPSRSRDVLQPMATLLLHVMRRPPWARGLWRWRRANLSRPRAAGTCRRPWSPPCCMLCGGRGGRRRDGRGAGRASVALAQQGDAAAHGHPAAVCYAAAAVGSGAVAVAPGELQSRSRSRLMLRPGRRRSLPRALLSSDSRYSSLMSCVTYVPAHDQGLSCKLLGKPLTGDSPRAGMPRTC